MHTEIQLQYSSLIFICCGEFRDIKDIGRRHESKVDKRFGIGELTELMISIAHMYSEQLCMYIYERVVMLEGL